MIESDLHWLAGYLEGEGSFTIHSPRYRTVQITVGSTDEEPINRVAVLFERNVNTAAYKTRVSKQPGVIYRTALTGKPALKMMTLLFPYMSSRRKAQIEKCLNHFLAEVTT